jgi:hypothetical protein
MLLSCPFGFILMWLMVKGPLSLLLDHMSWGLKYSHNLTPDSINQDIGSDMTAMVAFQGVSL